MAKCTKCGRYGIFMKVDSVFGLCEKCLAKEVARHKQEAIAFEMVSKAKSKASLANRTRNFEEFVFLFDEILDCLSNAAEIENNISYFIHINGSPSADYSKLLSEKQWHLRDALERNYDEITKNAKGVYRNNRRATIDDCEKLRRAIEKYKDLFDNETQTFANGILKKLSIKYGIIIDDQHDNQYMSKTIDFDNMEGHDFEYWCADLLRKNRYENVEVTQESGDQGVDIIAEKDDIRYAIQCKCYSSDIGNSAVQEAVAGKVFYKCHIGVVMTNRYFTKSARELANATGIVLWDRDRIKHMQDEHDNYETVISQQKDTITSSQRPLNSQIDNISCLDIDEEIEASEYDPRLPEAIDIVIDMGQASISMLQRRMRIGYAKAGRLIDEMAQRGIVSEADGAKPRQVLITREEAQAMFEE